MFVKFYRFLINPRTRSVLSWLVMLSLIVGRGWDAWVNFNNESRVDGNEGHAAIDFGGQWMLGRLLITGHPRDLYSRDVHLEVARASYPHDREDPKAAEHDAERLIGWYPAPADDPINGPLYPPIHSFYMAPVSAISDPAIAYRVYQAWNLLLILFAGLGIRYLTRGRWWWSTASVLLLLYPGCRGGLDLGQNNMLTLTFLIWGWGLRIHGYPIWGGIVWGLLAYKPVWAMSFFGALLLLQQWRMVLSMGLTGVALILATLPIVGLQCWFDWLHVGKTASEMYLVDRNWIFLSRDLFGIPRRIMLDFPDGRASNDRPSVAYAGWALWGFIAGITCLVMWFVWKRKKSQPLAFLTGPIPAFVFFAAWLCTYRFMYYDATIAAIGVIVLYANLHHFLKPAAWPLISWSWVFLGLVILQENALSPLNIEVSGTVHVLTEVATLPDQSTEKVLTKFHLRTSDEYPWDTVAVFLFWLWSLFAIVSRHVATFDEEEGVCSSPG